MSKRIKDAMKQLLAEDAGLAQDASESDVQGRANSSGMFVYQLREKRTGQEVELNQGQLKSMPGWKNRFDVVKIYKPVPVSKPKENRPDLQSSVANQFFKDVKKRGF